MCIETMSIPNINNDEHRIPQNAWRQIHEYNHGSSKTRFRDATQTLDNYLSRQKVHTNGPFSLPGVQGNVKGVREFREPVDQESNRQMYGKVYRSHDEVNNKRLNRELTLGTMDGFRPDLDTRVTGFEMYQMGQPPNTVGYYRTQNPQNLFYMYM